jgi:tRNA dimethylallyltransferase
MKIHALIGPTGSGKGQTAALVAERDGAEILSLDSMKVYRGMDIGTAKAPAERRARVPHHLFDLVDPTEPFSTSLWLAEAQRVIADLDRRGKLALLSGGTALYMKALLHGLFVGPEADWDLRDALKAEAAAIGTAALHARLRAVDPVAATRIDPNDLRRIVRALEVFSLTGTPISTLQIQFGAAPDRYEKRVFGLRRERADLDRRINRRVDLMFTAGLVEEVSGLLEQHERLGRHAAQALGYAEVLAHLCGETTLEEAQDAVRRHTRRFARRQLTWFRKMPYIEWIDVSPDAPPESVAARIRL